MEALLVVCFLSFSWISDCNDYPNRMFCYFYVDIRCEYATSIIKLTDVHTEIFVSQYLSYNKSLMGRHSKFLFQNHDFVSHMQSVSYRVLFYKESWRAIRPYDPGGSLTAISVLILARSQGPIILHSALKRSSPAEHGEPRTGVIAF